MCTQNYSVCLLLILMCHDNTDQEQKIHYIKSTQIGQLTDTNKYVTWRYHNTVTLSSVCTVCYTYHLNDSQ
jgi:hypothetical protein